MSEKTAINHTAILSKIIGNYSRLESGIADELGFSVEHHLTTGTFRERVWKQLLEQIVPRKFSIEQSVFIVSSDGKVSREVDLAIFDEQYTPYIFRYENIKYIPIEAVAVVVQCKSSNLVKSDLSDWVGSIQELKTSLRSITRMYTQMACGEFAEEDKPDNEVKEINASVSRSPRMTQTSTRPIRILCHTEKSTSANISELFDFVIYPNSTGKKLKVTVSRGDKTLERWHRELNHVGNEEDEGKQSFDEKTPVKDFTLDRYKVTGKDSEEEISILSLTFQLNQLLMLINNPLQFPHLAYVEMFNDIPRA